MEFAEKFKKRTKAFAIEVYKLVKSIPYSNESKIVTTQLFRSATSVAANYRAVCRARSKAEFISKLSIVVEEADETVFWLEFLVESDICNSDSTKHLLKEAEEILKIVASSRKTAKSSTP